jgi:hypothetical protein
LASVINLNSLTNQSFFPNFNLLLKGQSIIKVKKLDVFKKIGLTCLIISLSSCGGKIFLNTLKKNTSTPSSVPLTVQSLNIIVSEEAGSSAFEVKLDHSYAQVMTVKSFDENETVNLRLFLYYTSKCFQPGMQSQDIAEFLVKFIQIDETEVSCMLNYLKKIGRIPEEGEALLTTI